MFEIVINSSIVVIAFIMLFVLIYYFKISKFISSLLVKNSLLNLFLRLLNNEKNNIAIQVKDSRYRYVYYNDFLKKNLYPDKDYIIGMSDYEILTNKKIDDREFKQVLRNFISLMRNKSFDKIDNISICFLTDVYVDACSSGTTCRFLEVVGDKILDVYKSVIEIPGVRKKYLVGLYTLKYQGPDCDEKMTNIYKACGCLMRELYPGKIYKIESEAFKFNVI